MDAATFSFACHVQNVPPAMPSSYNSRSPKEDSKSSVQGVTVRLCRLGPSLRCKEMASIDATHAITISATSVLMSFRMLRGDPSKRLSQVKVHLIFSENISH